jgi:ribosomal protein S18 acetylase RimI-like enzyme
MADNLHFRVATSEDAPQLQQLVQSAFRAEDSRQDWTGDMALASKFRIEVKEIEDIMNAQESAFLSATDNTGSLVGTIGVSKRGDTGRLFMLAVDPRRHRGGLGKQVLAYAEGYCQRTWGTAKLGLNALSTRQTLIAWYMRRGYRKTGETSPFPREKFAELQLPEDMCFIELEKGLDTVAVAENAA